MLKNETEKKLNELTKLRKDEFEKLHYYFAELRKELDAREAALKNEYNQYIKTAEKTLLTDYKELADRVKDASSLLSLIKETSKKFGISSSIIHRKPE